MSILRPGCFDARFQLELVGVEQLRLWNIPHYRSRHRPLSLSEIVRLIVILHFDIGVILVGIFARTGTLGAFQLVLPGKGFYISDLDTLN